MEIDGKSFIYGALIIILILLMAVTLGIISFKSGNSTTLSGDNSGSNMPEKCKLPPGQDINSWKEHLGHHAETQECIKYYS